MADDGADRHESVAPKRRVGDTKETFSISLSSRTKARLDREVEVGRWGSRSQAVSYYLHRGIAAEDYADEYANRQLMMLDEISRSEEEGFDVVSVLLRMMKQPEFRRQLKQQVEASLDHE